jgi:hypothetical protein
MFYLPIQAIMGHIEVVVGELVVFQEKSVKKTGKRNGQAVSYRRFRGLCDT